MSKAQRVNKHRLTHYNSHQVYNALNALAIDGAIDAWPSEIAKAVSEKLGFDITSEQVVNMTCDLEIVIKRANGGEPNDFAHLAKVQRDLEALQARVARLEERCDKTLFD